MKRFLLLSMLLSGYLIGMNLSGKKIIPGASYLVYEDDDITDKVSCNSQLVHFYSADGEHLVQVQHDNKFTKMKHLLDPNAPLPQPVTCAIKFWPGYEVGANTPISEPGYFMVFYDKHSNRIKSYRYDTKARQIILSQTGEQKNLCPIRQLKDLDLSLISDEQKSPRATDAPEREKKCCIQ